MNCWRCDAEMRTERKNVRYHALPSVTLVGVEVHECPECGERQVEIPRIEELNDELAGHLARLERRFTPDEVQFLRKYLNLSGRELAEIMGVRPETVSRWENDNDVTMNEQAERLLRLLVAKSTSLAETFPAEFSAPDPEEHLKARDSDGSWRAAG